ncbi:MAG: DUF4838 domain-containing protein [Pirellulaceae bacterium]|nr:DUF4838 domain-containing protein [Pirellulaceae bacterium]
MKILKNFQWTAAAWIAAALCCPTAEAVATEVVLAAEGQCEYQIVVPDTSPTSAIGECLQQAARLLQTAFVANGVAVESLPIVAESARDPQRPAIYLGNTAFARAHGIDVAALPGWGYVHRVVEQREVIIAGRDHPAPDQSDNSRRPTWDRIGTAKGVADFVRQYAGTRFLYPDLAPYQSVKAAAQIDLLASPAIEFLPAPTIAVPDDLDAQHTPTIAFNTAHPAGGSFYDLANNRFPRVDEVFGGHTWERAVPVEEYRESHPEYFALVGGQRLLDDRGQYCISNPAVRELIYADLCRWLDRGYLSVDLGQPDGFRPCQCEGCAKLYDTGDDWGEKIWRFHAELAERLLVSHPGKQVTIMSYIQTALPPKTFTKFPANTKIMLTGTNEEDIAPWRGYEVPGGFTGYLYNWCPNLGTRYTPMRTPSHVETQAKRLAANHIQSFYRDGPGALYGLEGPVYYTMGRMFDDPERLSAKDLVPEFIDAAFGGPSAWHMRQFYDQLYHGITLYSDYLGTRSPAWTYQPAEGRRRKTVSDPFQLLAFLYPPPLLASLESHLAQAEQKASTDKVKSRLALVRREFDYVKDLARVVHLYHAYEIQPDLASRDRLLDAIDARNARIAAYYDPRGRAVPASDGWALVMFPPAGHSASHLRLAYNNYQEPFESTCVNWDTAAVRAAPLPGAKRLTVRLVEGPLTLDSAVFSQSEASELTALPSAVDAVLPTGKTTLRALADDQRLYVRIDSNLPAAPQRADANGETEAIEVLLSPVAGSPVAYRFRVGPQDAARQDAATGFVSDAMDPRYGQFDPDWSGDWNCETRVAADGGAWTALITVPFKTLGVAAPQSGTFWRGNVGRASRSGADPQRLNLSAWSTAAGMRRLDDPNAFGELHFEDRSGVR